MYDIFYNRLMLVVLLTISVIPLAVTFSSQCEKEREKFKIPREHWQQRVTMANIRQVDNAVWQYADQNGELPPPPVANHPLPIYKAWSDLSGNFIRYPRPPYPWPIDPRREVSKLKPLLVPWFTKELPTVDYWGHPLYYDVSADRKHLVVISLGSDGDADQDLVSYFPVKEPWHDVACFDMCLLSFAYGYVR